MSVDSSNDADNLEDAITDIMYRIEGISHFIIEQFYTFDYLQSYVTLNNPTVDAIINEWYTTFIGYNSQMQE